MTAKKRDEYFAGKNLRLMQGETDQLTPQPVIIQFNDQYPVAFHFHAVGNMLLELQAIRTSVYKFVFNLLIVEAQ